MLWACDLKIDLSSFDKKVRLNLAWMEDLCCGLEQWMKPQNYIQIAWRKERNISREYSAYDIMRIELYSEELSVVKWAFKEIMSVCRRAVHRWGELCSLLGLFPDIKWDDFKKEIDEALKQVYKFSGSECPVYWCSKSKVISVRLGKC